MAERVRIRTGPAPQQERGNPLAAVAADSLAQAIERATPAMRAARAAQLNATVTPWVDELASALASAERLVQTTTRRAEQLARDDTANSDGLAASWTEMRDAYISAAGTVRGRIRAAVGALERDLFAAALPKSRSDSSALLARQEVEATLAAAHPARVGQAAIELAGQGGEVAAALASPWGKATLARLGAGDAAHTAVIAAGIDAATRDDRTARIAEAFLSTGGFREAAGLATTGLHIAERDLGAGGLGGARERRQMHAGRHGAGPDERHADLREIAEADVA